MQMGVFRVVILGAIVGCGSMLLSACFVIVPGSYSGGGTIPNKSRAGNGKATFTFSGDSCNGSLEGSVNYHDMAENPSVKLVSTDIIETGLCIVDIGVPSDLCATCAETFGFLESGEGPVYAAAFHYRSTNPSEPGTGTAIICVQDNGEGHNVIDKDLAAILVSDGPFTGYQNSGKVSGNVQAGSCD